MTRVEVLENVRPEIRRLRAYHLEPRAARIKLDQNENAFGLPKGLLDSLWRDLQSLELWRYPTFAPREVEEALGGLNDWPGDGVRVGSGSNELIQALGLVTLEPGRPVVVPSPSFAVYAQVARVLGAEVVEVPLTAELSYDVEAFKEALARHRPRLAFICSPNNPTGTVLSSGALESILEGYSGILAVDEAYHEFSGSTGHGLLVRYPQLVLLRTFSKALGMAGLRIGYLLAQPDLAREIGKAQLPYSLGLVPRAAALVVCRHRELLLAQVQQIREQREVLQRRLAAMSGIRTYPSGANFILFETGRPARAVYEALLSRGVLVRDVSAHPRLSRALRVSVGRPEENEAFLEALEKALESHHE